MGRLADLGDSLLVLGIRGRRYLSRVQIMPLVHCRECAQVVNEQTEICPSCGLKSPGKEPRGCGCFFLLLILAAFAGPGGLFVLIGAICGT